MSYVVQSVLLKRSKFDKGGAYKWMREHEYAVHKIHVTPEYFHFRQVDPSRVKGAEFRTIDLGDVGKLVLAYL